jgi:hypothetical protein
MSALFMQTKQHTIWEAACALVLNLPGWKPTSFKKAVKGPPAILRKAGLLFARLAEPFLKSLDAKKPVPVDISVLVQAAVSDEFEPYGITWRDLEDAAFQAAWKRHLKTVKSHLNVLEKAGYLQKIGERYSLTERGIELARKLAIRVPIRSWPGWISNLLRLLGVSVPGCRLVAVVA